MALISDLHGNEVALRAVLEDARGLAVDRVVCLGDCFTLGPRPLQVADMLQELGCLCILGNHDEFMLDEALIHTYSEAPVIVAAVDACRAEMRQSDFEFIRGFRRTHRFSAASGAEVLLYHGTTRSNMEDLLPTTAADDVDAMLGFGDERQRPAIAAGGHTHIQMARQHRGTLVVNPGSVGLPFLEHAAGGPPTVLGHAEYAVVDITQTGTGATLRRLPLEPAALKAQLQGWDNPLSGMLAAMWS